MQDHDDVGKLRDRWVASLTPLGWHTRWRLRHRSAINLPDMFGGIETDVQRLVLLIPDCRRGQGYLFVAGIPAQQSA